MSVPAGRPPAERLAEHRHLAAHLSGLGPRALAGLLDRVSGTGIGGQSGTVLVDGVPVFVKAVPLTDLERRPGHLLRTANLFDLPACYHYGIGSAGFGAWRELAVHLRTTGWVRDGEYQGFPLTHHWRVLPTPPPAPSAYAEHGDLAATVRFWGGSPAVRARLTALTNSSASVVLFCEHVPYTLAGWLAARTNEGVGAASELAERELAAGVGFMNSRGLLHFDAHFENVLTDGGRLYFADYGLAISTGFSLSPAESAFRLAHLDYDRAYVATALSRCLDRLGPGLPDVAATVAERYRPVATIAAEFFHRLRTRSRATRYPAERIASALNAARPD